MLRLCLVIWLSLVPLVLLSPPPIPTPTFEDPYDRVAVDGIPGVKIEQGGRDHECYRECKANEEPKICTYNVTVATSWTMSNKCGKCPFTVEDCFKPGCVAGNGYKREISVANEMLPGPGVLVCLNDTIIFNVQNGFESDSTSIHFHGAHQRGSPWMDGSPYITQCPILPGNSFQYKFTADPAGTHMWHGHTGLHEADGLFGHYIVRKPEDFNNDLYDVDDPDHTMIIWLWMNATSKHYISNIDRRTIVSDLIINGKSAKLEYEQEDGKTVKTPQAEFVVEKGKRYRFRTIFNSAFSCPVQFSIDKHNLKMIATDSGEIKPLEVDSFMAHAGERFDFVLEANAKSDAYWIRLRSLKCGSGDVIEQEAILRYKDSKKIVPSKKPESGHREGKLFNPIEVFTHQYPNQELIKLTDVDSKEPTRDIKGTPDMTLYLELHFKDGYGAPQINGITFAYPHSPLVSQWTFTNNTCTGDTAERHCINGRCVCSYVQPIRKDSLIEIILIDTTTGFSTEHPMHLHGDHFQPVAMEVVGDDISVELVRSMNLNDQIKKKFENVFYKDTISVPNRGFAVLRTIANNPGYWFFHCHFTNHAHDGMAMVFKIGDPDKDIPEAPAGFPQCDQFPSERSGTTSVSSIPQILSLQAILIALAYIINH